MFRLLSLFLSISAASASLEQPFLDWITANMGSVVAGKLNRMDLTNNGGTGSFGGGVGPLTRRPIVIVNGRANDAGQYGGNRNAFNASGWDANHVLATTYGGGNGGLNGSAYTSDKLSCQNVQQIRWMLEAVIGYYNSSIDVIAYSMGSPIARKAILGGNCVETLAYLGSPLTSSVHTYVSVAGANKGARQCQLFPYNLVSPCYDATIGMKCGNAFYNDINNSINVGYEGQFRHYIFSTADEVIGSSLSGALNGCSNAGNPAWLPGTGNFTQIATGDHTTTIFTNTAQQVAAMLTYLSL